MPKPKAYKKHQYFNRVLFKDFTHLRESSICVHDESTRCIRYYIPKVKVTDEEVHAFVTNAIAEHHSVFYFEYPHVHYVQVYYTKEQDPFYLDLSDETETDND